MFKINKLTLYNFNGNPYTYEAELQSEVLVCKIKFLGSDFG